LVVDEALRTAIASSAPSTRLMEIAKAGGFRTMLEDGLGKASRGITSLEEVVRSVGTE